MTYQTLDRILEIPYGLEKISYSPSDARVECYGLEIAIKNRDFNTFKYLWSDFYYLWGEKHFAFVLDKVLQEGDWDAGLQLVFRSKTSRLIYRALCPEDKDNFLVSKIVDKITDSDYWEVAARSPIRVNQTLVHKVITELSYDPYGPFAVLKFPNLFQKAQLLEQTLKKVQIEDIGEFKMARKENTKHFNTFQDQFTEALLSGLQTIPLIKMARLKHQGLLEQLASIARQAEEPIQPDPILNPSKVIKLIKIGDADALIHHLEQNCGGLVLLERLNLMVGFEDEDYVSVFKQSVKYIPTDEIMRILTNDSTTTHWNPLIFAIYYQRTVIVEYLCEKWRMTPVRSCLLRPFLMQPSHEEFESLDTA